jgi:hypothetical protein
MDRNVFRWGGLAGVLGGIVFIVVFVVVVVFVGADLTPTAEELVERFPDIQGARTVEDGLYLLVLILWVVHFLALYRALRETRLASALFGSVLGIVGLTVLAAGALPHVAKLHLSDLYHAAKASAADQASVVLMWQLTQGIFDALLIAGLGVLPIALLAIGHAMLGTPAFGKVLGWMTIALGAIGLLSAVVLLIDPLSSIAVAGIFALIIFNLTVGWKVYRLST